MHKIMLISNLPIARVVLFRKSLNSIYTDTVDLQQQKENKDYKVESCNKDNLAMLLTLTDIADITAMVFVPPVITHAPVFRLLTELNLTNANIIRFIKIDTSKTMIA